jgi:hypothetical protein
MHRIVLFIRQEYLTSKKFMRGEYSEAKKSVRKEFRDVKKALRKEFGSTKEALKTYCAWQKQAQQINMVISGLGTALSFANLFRSNEVTLAPMRAQGLRTTVNKGGMFVTGLLSVCLLLLAPIMGAEKILKQLRPIIDLIKHLPYATWLITWLNKWWNGEVKFEDLPQDSDELKEHLGHLNEDDATMATLDELAEVNQKFNRKRQKVADKRLELRKKAKWEITKSKESSGYNIEFKPKKSTTYVSEEQLLPVLNAGWTKCPSPIIFGNFVSANYEEMEERIENGTSSPSDSDSESGEDLADMIPNPYKPKVQEKKPLIDFEKILRETNPQEVDEVEQCSISDDDDFERRLNKVNKRVEEMSNSGRYREREKERKRKEDAYERDGDSSASLRDDDKRECRLLCHMDPNPNPNVNPKGLISGEGYVSDATRIYEGQQKRENADLIDTSEESEDIGTGVGLSAASSEIPRPGRKLELRLHPQAGGPGALYDRLVNMYGSTWAYILNSFDWTGSALPSGEIADNQAVNFEPQPFWDRCKAHYNRSWSSLYYYVKWRAGVFVNRHRRVTLFSVVLSAVFLCYALGCFKAMQEWSTKSRLKAKQKNQAITAAGLKKKAVLKALKDVHMQRKKGRRGRAGKSKFFQPSGNVDTDALATEFNNLPDYEPQDDDGQWIDFEDDAYDQAQEEYYDYLANNKGKRWDEQEFQKRYDEKRDSRVRIPIQALKEAVPMRDDARLRRAIYKSKRQRVPRVDEVYDFMQLAQAAYAKQMTEPLAIQAWSPSRLAAGVYKIFCGDRYLCTGTHVGNKLFVVVHSLSEDITLEYKAVNHVHSHKLFGKDIVLVNEEIAYFPICGIPSPFKGHHMKIMKDASIVTVFGFGNGQADQPDAITGFASPLGWCNAPTRDGDCTSPVLDVNGNVVGFWTHGNGLNFGRFEAVTEAMIQVAKSGVHNHAGLDFQLAPHSL